MSVTIRDRADRCPGILRPWPAADGLLVRVRLIGGHATAAQLRGLVAAASAFGDGRIRPTTRANLQLRAFPGTDGVLDADALAAIEASGLLPAPTHDRVRNITVSPQTGIAGGRADLRGVAAELDALIVASSVLPSLPGKFAFVLDDGRGDLIDRICDLGWSPSTPTPSNSASVSTTAPSCRSPRPPARWPNSPSVSAAPAAPAPPPPGTSTR